jgi:hypothetical protein
VVLALFDMLQNPGLEVRIPSIPQTKCEADNTSQGFVPSLIARLFISAGSVFRHLSASLWRFIVLAALGAVMIWLFSPWKRERTVSPDGDRPEAANVPVLGAATQAAEASTKPDLSANLQTPGRIPTATPSEPSATAQKDAGKPIQQRRATTFRPGRQAASKESRAKLRRAQQKTLYQKQIAELIALWRRSSLSGARHQNRSVSSN